MVEERTSRGKSHDNNLEPIFWVVLLLILFSALAGLPAVLDERYGVNADNNALFGLFERPTPLTVDTPLGTKTIHAQEAQMRTTPGGEIIATQQKGTTGTVVGGPVLREEILWWQIEYKDGTVGWVSGSYIVIDPARNRRALKENTPLGSKTINRNDANVRNVPDGGFVLTTKAQGAIGTIEDSPIFRNGVRFWKVAYEDDTVGWVIEDDLEIDIARNDKAIKVNTPLKTSIENIISVDVRDRPHGNILGTQSKGEHGKLIGGPALSDGARFWNVDYKKKADGWVPEKALEKRFSLINILFSFGAVFKLISYSLSLAFFFGIIYVFVKLRRVNEEEYKLYKPTPVSLDGIEKHENERWKKVLEHVESENINDWRHAILEADVLLNELVTRIGYDGENLGEKLKGVERSDFLTIDQAWEAHKIRNTLAHEGSEYLLSQREARRIIDLYRQVFNEFRFI